MCNPPSLAAIINEWSLHTEYSNSTLSYGDVDYQGTRPTALLCQRRDILFAFIVLHTPYTTTQEFALVGFQIHIIPILFVNKLQYDIQIFLAQI